jgi:DNA modification methylase
MNAPDARSDIRHHTWQKPDLLAERFIRHSTTPGALILDPFAGTGTFLAASARLGRRGIGCEQDPAMLDICRSRGLEVLINAA